MYEVSCRTQGVCTDFRNSLADNQIVSVGGAEASERTNFTLGANLTTARIAAGMTQEAVAARLGIRRASISDWENDRHVPSATSLHRLAVLYRTPMPALLRGTGAEGAVYGNPDDTAKPAQYEPPRGTETAGAVREVPPPPPSEEWTPSATLRAGIPDRVYEVALGYLRRLERAKVPREQLEEIERVLLDNRYAKQNKRTGRPLSEDDLILLMDATWEAIAEVLSWQGIRP